MLPAELWTGRIDRDMGTPAHLSWRQNSVKFLVSLHTDRPHKAQFNTLRQEQPSDGTRLHWGCGSQLNFTAHSNLRPQSGSNTMGIPQKNYKKTKPLLSKSMPSWGIQRVRYPYAYCVSFALHAQTWTHTRHLGMRGSVNILLSSLAVVKHTSSVLPTHTMHNFALH